MVFPGEGFGEENAKVTDCLGAADHKDPSTRNVKVDGWSYRTNVVWGDLLGIEGGELHLVHIDGEAITVQPPNDQGEALSTF